MQQVTADIFHQTIQHWECVPFSQTKGWLLMQSGNQPQNIIYLLDENIGCAAYVKRFLHLKMLWIDTECMRYQQTKARTIQNFYRDLLTLHYDIVSVNSRHPYFPAYEVGIRQAGLLRPVGSFSYSLTNLIDLTQDIHFDENWRRNLKKADPFQLQLESITQPTTADYADVMRLYSQMSQFKKVAIPFTRTTLDILLQDTEHFNLYFMQTPNGERISAIIIHRVGNRAGLLYAANGDKAGSCYAGFEMYRQLLTRLQAGGITQFDMEKMGASTHSTNAVFQFKQGIHGELLPLCGEWLYTRRPWMQTGLYFVNKYLWKRTQA